MCLEAMSAQCWFMNSDASTSSQLSPSFSHVGLGRQHGKATPASSPLATPRVFQAGVAQAVSTQNQIAEATPLTHYSAAEKQLFATPADTVLNHFRVVRLAELACALACQLSAAKLRKPVCRQQEQALQNQRHDALQRLSDHHASVAARQQIASGRADSQMALLMQRYNHKLAPCYQEVCWSGHLSWICGLIRNGRKLPPNLMKDATLLMDRSRCGRPPSRAGQNTGRSSQLSLAPNSAPVCTGHVTMQLNHLCINHI